ncbi:MAG: hypothetical protein NTY38_21935 [Acidobacteria bacterium]|nr:hypothetical protein [Acidobacteriota bacterium]
MLENALVRVEVDSRQERFLARAGDGRWVEVASGVPVAASAIAADGPAIREASGGVERTIRLEEGNWLKVESRLTGAGELHSFRDRYRFAGKPDWSYSPSVGGFNPDAQYKTPLILVQAGRTAFGVVADVTALDRAALQRSNHALDLDVPAGPFLTVGFVPARRAFHAVYREDGDKTWHAGGPVVNRYFLYVTAQAEPNGAYREAVRFVWRRFARPALQTAARQQAGTDPRYQSLGLWDGWRRMIWEEESKANWLTVPLPDGSTGGAVRMLRWGAPKPSLYLGSWFNSMRTAYGMALYARRAGKPELLAMARQTLQAALAAPGVEGAFKCIAVPSGTGVEWAAGDGAGDSTRSGFLGFDMAWTGYWLLQWRAAQLPGSQAVPARAERLAGFLIARQDADGMLPTRFDESGAVEPELSRMVRAETGAVARFLLELYRQDRRPAYLQAARKALEFLDREVVPERKWYDFETFWSCSPRLIAFDERSHQWPANNLALIHAVGAYLAAFEVTGERSFLARGEALLDYLLLYQQVWTNPLVEDLTSPVMLLGGFTTQNSDAEWSDARQSLCGDVLLDYYRATGKAEYLERGVAALRAQFPVSPSENWAHVGYGKKAGVSGFHWGSGSGMAGIEKQEEFLRDAAVDLPAVTGVGVNGLNVEEFAVSGDRISLRLSSPFGWTREPVLSFHGVRRGASYRLSINGKELGRIPAAALEKGIPAPGFRP